MDELPKDLLDALNADWMAGLEQADSPAPPEATTTTTETTPE
jgi:hypothetical protein